MNDHREPTPPALEAGDEVLVGELLEGPTMTAHERRLAELRDPAGPTFVSPSGDRRERAVPCQRCRRSKTFALRGVCVPCLEAELELCDHLGDERVERIAHGYLGDAPAGTRELLCSGCGSEVAS